MVPSELLHDLPDPVRDFLVHGAILGVVGVSEPSAAEFLLDEVEGCGRGRETVSRLCARSRGLWEFFTFVEVVFVPRRRLTAHGLLIHAVWMEYYLRLRVILLLDEEDFGEG